MVGQIQWCFSGGVFQIEQRAPAVEELDNFRIVKKPSEQLVGYIQCAFGGSSFKAGLLPKDLIRIAADQASQAKFSNKSHVKFDLSNHQAA